MVRLPFFLSCALALLPAGTAVHAQTVICFGDSLTAGTGAAAGESYPDFLRKDLAAAGYKAVVLNRGVDGSTTADALLRLPSVLAEHPSVVVLELGPNDAIYGKSTAETEHNLRAMIEVFQNAHAQVVLGGFDMRPFAAKLPPGLVTPAFQALFPLHGELASAYRIPDIPFFLDGVYGVFGLMSQDYLHPNGLGYRKVAQTVLPYVESALGKPGT